MAKHGQNRAKKLASRKSLKIAARLLAILIRRKKANGYFEGSLDPEACLRCSVCVCVDEFRRNITITVSKSYISVIMEPLLDARSKLKLIDKIENKESINIGKKMTKSEIIVVNVVIPMLTVRHDSDHSIDAQTN